MWYMIGASSRIQRAAAVIRVWSVVEYVVVHGGRYTSTRSAGFEQSLGVTWMRQRRVVVLGYRRRIKDIWI